MEHWTEVGFKIVLASSFNMDFHLIKLVKNLIHD